MKTLFFAMGFISAAAFAVPVEDGETTIEQDPLSCLVTISYGIKDEPAIVTVDIQTNGPSGYVSIDQRCLTNVTGDVNARIGVGQGKRIYWQPPAEDVVGRFRAKNARAVVTLHATNSPPDYLVLDLSQETAAGAASCRFYPNADQIPLGVTDRLYKSRYYVLRRIHAAGRPWPMGARSKEPNISGNEIRHWVALPEDYYLGVYEVTQGHMNAIGLGWPVSQICDTGAANAEYCPAAGKPGATDGITYMNVRGCDNWPSASDHSLTTDWGYLQHFRNRVGTSLLLDIPTDAQWEYAARADAYSTSYAHGMNTAEGLGEYAWYADSVPAGTAVQEVGTRQPNAWGLYDMFGNVSEWCLDNFQYNCGLDRADYDEVDFVGPPVSYSGTDYKVVRGGSHADPAQNLRSAYRLNVYKGAGADTVGYRLSLPVVFPY